MDSGQQGGECMKHANYFHTRQAVSPYMKYHDKQIADAVVSECKQQAVEIEADYWRRCIGVGILAFREVVGSASKTEKFATRYAEMLDIYRDAPIEQVVSLVERVSGIELVVQ